LGSFASARETVVRARPVASEIVRSVGRVMRVTRAETRLDRTAKEASNFASRCGSRQVTGY
jgi:hypothetical protein